MSNFTTNLLIKDFNGINNLHILGSGDILLGENSALTTSVIENITSWNNMPIADFYYSNQFRKVFVRSIIVSEIGDPPDIAIRRASGTYPNGTPSQVLSGENIGTLYWQGFTDDANYQCRQAQIYARAAENLHSSSAGGNLFLATTPIGGTSTLDRITILHNGNVGIGNTSPNALLDIGNAGSILGTIRLEGSTSGYAQIQPTAEAGNVTITLPAKSGTVAMTSDITGGGSSDMASFVRVYLTNTQTISSGSFVKVGLDAETVDNLGEFDTANNRFTATTAGWYLICVHGHWNSPVSGTRYMAYIYKNGSDKANGSIMPGGTADQTTEAHDLMYLAVGDYVEMYVRQDSGSNDTLYGGEYRTYMFIQKLH